METGHEGHEPPRERARRAGEWTAWRFQHARVLAIDVTRGTRNGRIAAGITAMKTDVPRSALQAHPFITTIAERVRIASAMRAVGCVQHRRHGVGGCQSKRSATTKEQTKLLQT